MAVDDEARLKRPAFACFLLDALQLSLGHAGIMLERHLLDGRPPAWSRTVPRKVTMAPMSVRPALSVAISAPMSKSSVWTRITLASRHRREEGDLAGGSDRSVMAHMGLVDRSPDHFGAGESVVEFRPAGFQPSDQLGDGGNLARQVHVLCADAGLLLDPGEIEEAQVLCASSS